MSLVRQTWESSGWHIPATGVRTSPKFTRPRSAGRKIKKSYRCFFVSHFSHFHILKWPFPHSRFGTSSSRKSKNSSEYKHTPNQWEIWPQKPLLTTGKLFFSWGKVRKTRFFQNLLNSRFWALWFLIYTLSCAKLKKIHRDRFNESQSMFLALVKPKCHSVVDRLPTSIRKWVGETD